MTCQVHAEPSKIFVTDEAGRGMCLRPVGRQASSLNYFFVDLDTMTHPWTIVGSPLQGQDPYCTAEGRLE